MSLRPHRILLYSVKECEGGVLSRRLSKHLFIVFSPSIRRTKEDVNSAWVTSSSPTTHSTTPVMPTLYLQYGCYILDRGSGAIWGRAMKENKMEMQGKLNCKERLGKGKKLYGKSIEGEKKGKEN